MEESVFYRTVRPNEFSLPWEGYIEAALEAAETPVEKGAPKRGWNGRCHVTDSYIFLTDGEMPDTKITDVTELSGSYGRFGARKVYFAVI